ncbi:fumarylacetoacetate hydrolase family protein [Ornithinibacillus scapharcae]|uniref:fumarylacetoacetate hydrolase family protein n=1 Tax=Ornithinibacillus scapharcae TaxID=1147159 RepID=UPI000225B691|nr:fumarylacetoacetate hydrolase family protein [Ornithinibacillus scapharcae]
MKLVSYHLKEKDSPFRIGIMMEGKILDIQDTYRTWNKASDTIIPSDPSTFFKTGAPMIKIVEEMFKDLMVKNFEDVLFYPRDEVHLGIPIPGPSKIICVGRNYVEHAQEMNSDIPEYPVLFAKFANALIGPEDDIEKTPLTEKLDYEVELTILIGKEASQVKREDALDYIAGYTIGNDVTARDLQKRTPQWLQGKTIDRSTPIGPWIVTPDEIGNPGALDVRCYVNGELRQSSNTEKFIFDIPTLIEFISGLITLKPGDVIMTGTPEGVAFGMDQPKFLQDGDLVTLEIEKIGRLENRVRNVR